MLAVSSEAIAAEGALVFVKACEMDLERVEAGRQPLPQRNRPAVAQVQKPAFTRT